MVCAIFNPLELAEMHRRDHHRTGGSPRAHVRPTITVTGVAVGSTMVRTRRQPRTDCSASFNFLPLDCFGRANSRGPAELIISSLPDVGNMEAQTREAGLSCDTRSHKAALLCEPLHTNVFVADSRLSSMIIDGHRGDERAHAGSHDPHNRGGNNGLTCFYILGSESE